MYLIMLKSPKNGVNNESVHSWNMESSSNIILHLFTNSTRFRSKSYSFFSFAFRVSYSFLAEMQFLCRTLHESQNGSLESFCYSSSLYQSPLCLVNLWKLNPFFNSWIFRKVPNFQYQRSSAYHLSFWIVLWTNLFSSTRTTKLLHSTYPGILIFCMLLYELPPQLILWYKSYLTLLMVTHPIHK